MSKFLEEEASLDSNEPEERNAADSSEEDEGEDAFEKDDFLVDDDDEDASDGDRHRRSRKKEDTPVAKKKRRRDAPDADASADDDELADDDIELLKDSGIKVQKKRRRLKKADARRGDYDDNDDFFNLDDEDDFGDFDDSPRAKRRSSAGGKRASRGDENALSDEDDLDRSEDEMDDFIEGGRKRGGRGKRAVDAMGDAFRHVVNRAAVEDAMDLFGNAHDMTRYKGSQKLWDANPEDGEEAADDDDDDNAGNAAGSGSAAEGSDKDDDDDDDDSEAVARRKQRRNSRGKAAAAAAPSDDPAGMDENAAIAEETGGYLAKVAVSLEPELARERYLTPADAAIRALDVPEALQLHLNATSFAATRQRGRSFDLPPTPDQAEIDKEAAWIYLQAFKGSKFGGFNGRPFDKDDLIAKITKALYYLYVEHCDVPFIATYRRESLEPEIILNTQGQPDWSPLWLILEYDRKWASLKRRKARLERGVTSDVPAEAGVDRQILNAIQNQIPETKSEAQLKDLENYLLFQVQLARTSAEMLVAAEGGGAGEAKRVRKRPMGRTRDRYWSLMKEKVHEFGAKFGMSSGELAENIGAMFNSVRAEDINQDPIAYAAEWVTVHDPKFAAKNPSRLLNAARYMLVTEIAAEPVFVAKLRSFWMDQSVVTVQPTLKAVKEVGDDHLLRLYCNIDRLPLRALLDSSEFLKIEKVEEEGFGTVDIKLPPGLDQELKAELKSLYLSDGISMAATAWNKERETILFEAYSLVVKDLKKEFRQLLLEKARIACRLDVGRSSLSQFLQRKVEIDGIDGSPAVLAFSLAVVGNDPAVNEQSGQDTKSRRLFPGNSLLTIAALDQDGEVINTYELNGAFLKRKRREPCPDNIAREIRMIFEETKPGAIIIGLGNGIDATRLHEDLAEVVAYFVGDNKSVAAALSLSNLISLDIEETKEYLKRNSILYLEERIGKAYGDSKFAKKNLSSMSTLQRRAVGLARAAQEPISVFSAIASDKDAIQSYEINDDQNLLSPGDYFESCRRGMVQAVSVVGLDFNRSIVHPHFQPILQFIVGPRKAEAAYGKLVKGPGKKLLSSRKELYERQILSKLVFISAVGFLRVRDPSLAVGGGRAAIVAAMRKSLRRKEAKGIFYPLDDTRVHPEHYNVATRIAEEALRDPMGEAEDRTSEDPAKQKNILVKKLIEVMIEDNSKLEVLDLEEYAKHLETLGRGKMHRVVTMIVDEFKSPFNDPRGRLANPTEDKIFFVSTGLSPSRFRIGAMVTAGDCQARSVGVSCRLDGGVRGFIPRGEVADDMDDADIQKLIPQGISTSCRILKIDFQQFDARVTTRASCLANPNMIEGYIPPLITTHKYFKDFPPEEDFERKAIRKLGRTTANVRRRSRSNISKQALSHPCYRDLNSAKEAESLLLTASGTDGAAAGEIILHPASQDLMFSIKYAEDPNVPILHIPVMEETDTLTRGASHFLVKGITERYSSLDEIYMTLLSPMVNNLLHAAQNRKFVTGGENALKARCLSDKRARPDIVPYFISHSYRFSGCLALAFLPRGGLRKVRFEVIRVLPEGFKMLKSMHLTLEKLFTWFKVNADSLTKERPLGEGGITAPGTPRRVIPAPQSSFEHNAADPMAPPRSPFHAAPLTGIPAIGAALDAHGFGGMNPGLAPGLTTSLNLPSLGFDIRAPQTGYDGPPGGYGGPTQNEPFRGSKPHGFEGPPPSGQGPPYSDGAPNYGVAPGAHIPPPPGNYGGPPAPPSRSFEGQQRQDDNRPPPDSRGGPSRDNRGQTGRDDGGAPSWRGQKPIPAWASKK